MWRRLRQCCYSQRTCFASTHPTHTHTSNTLHTHTHTQHTARKPDIYRAFISNRFFIGHQLSSQTNTHTPVTNNEVQPPWLFFYTHTHKHTQRETAGLLSLSWSEVLDLTWCPTCTVVYTACSNIDMFNHSHGSPASFQPVSLANCGNTPQNQLTGSPWEWRGGHTSKLIARLTRAWADKEPPHTPR